MVRKKLAVAILALSALQANIANAMGLGNLSVKSALNQPLSAEIKLLDTGDLDPSQIKIQLAAPEDFQRAGVDRDFFLTNLKFNIDMDGHGGGIIKVTTREPVVEPYLNFVIEARWPNGRLLREFAVLLDPPTFSADKAAVTPAAPASSGPRSVKQQAVQPPTVKTEAETTATLPAGDNSLPPAGKPGEYRVQLYDTLSKIAAHFKPNDVSVAQTMIAIQRANPNAFIRDNVNLIKSGAVLRVPSAEDMRAVSAAQAQQDVEAQTQQWRGGVRASAATATRESSGPQLDASAPPPSEKEGGYREQARLSIATAGDADKGGKSGGGSGKGTEALRQQLTESQEALEKGKRDNKEMQSRLDDMERQIATLQRLISLKDEQLAALQAKSGSNSKMTQSAAELAKPTASVPAPATSEAASQAAVTPAPSTESSVAPEAATPAPAATPKPATPPEPKPMAKPAPQPEPGFGFVDQIISDRSYYLYGGLAALVAALGAPLLIKHQRRKAWAERQAEADALAFDANDDFHFEKEAFDDGESSRTETELIQDSESEKAVADEHAAEPKKEVRSETGDPIAESDIYIAYGRYQQAVDLLTNAIEAEPGRSDLRVKLLEVYVEMRNKDAFRKQFIELQGLGDSGAVAHVKDMLSSVDGISDWLENLPNGSGSSMVGAAFAATAATAAATDELDLDLDFDDEPATAQASFTTDAISVDTPASQDEESSAELDLDLDDELLTGNEVEAELPKSFMTEEAFESAGTDDLELDDLDLETGEADAPAFETSAFETSPSTSEVAQSELEGLELDLGDDDLDRALSNMGNGEQLDDLEDLSKALDADDGTVETSFDLDADPEALPEEFDLSQPAGELAEIERGNEAPVNLDFAEPAAEPAPELDVFAGLNEPAVSQSGAAASASEGGDDFDFLADTDEVATKLDLARAYIDMGDTEGAKDILDEVLQEGSDTQKQEASTLLSRMG